MHQLGYTDLHFTLRTYAPRHGPLHPEAAATWVPGTAQVSHVEQEDARFGNRIDSSPPTSTINSRASMTDAQRPCELEPGELIGDHELLATADDAFGHADFVDEIAQIAMAAEPPASIGLFAPWGSGKSSIGRLLGPAVTARARAEEAPQTVEYVTLNAFRYGEHPLRRHMIGEMAERLLGPAKGRRFVEERVYRTVTRRHLRRPQAGSVGDTAKAVRTQLRPMASAALADVRGFLGPMLALLGFLLLLMLAGVDIGRAVVGAVTILYTVAVLIAAGFIAVMRSNLTYSSSREALTSAEEFERAFAELLKQPGVRDLDRIVVFIDELDRCAAPEVVGTLEAIRTFLEADRCVFVVAADHQVLEQALATAARQETPLDTANPYYSAGNAYLDKIFQFQFTLPPLKPQQLSEFAYSKVNGNVGVWKRIPHLDHVISVLIPSHVDSPRRVKVLLNSFAIAYRIAERRVEENRIPADLGARASELAKIVCLRCEFPLFARELKGDPGIVRAVHQYSLRDEDDRETPPQGVSRQVWEKASAYADGSLPAIRLLAYRGRDDSSSQRGTPEDVFSTNARHLLAYLQKTRHVPLVRSDLVFLSTDTHNGRLAPAVAERLRAAGLDGDLRGALDTVWSLDTDDQRSAAIESLAGLVRERPLGVEGSNAVGVLLAVAGAGTDADGQAALRAVEAINTYPDLRLQADHLAPSLGLVLKLPDTAVRRVLERRLVGDSRLTELPAVARVLIAQGDKELKPALADARNQAITRCITSGELSVDAFERVSDAVAARHLVAASRTVQKRLTEPRFPEGEEDEEALASFRDELESAVRFLDSLLRSQTYPQSSRVWAAIIAAVENADAEAAVLSHREELARKPGEELSAVALRRASFAERAKIDQWLTMVDPVTIGVLGGQEALRAVAVHIWHEVEKDPHPEDWASEGRAYLQVLLAIATVARVSLETDPSFLPALLSDEFTTDARLSALQATDELAAVFLESGVVDSEALADRALRSCARTLEVDANGVHEPRENVVPAVLARVRRWAPLASRPIAEELSAVAAATNWLTEPERAEVAYMLAGKSGIAIHSSVPSTADEVVGFVGTHGDTGIEAATLWLSMGQVDARGLAGIVVAINASGAALSPDQESRIRRSAEAFDGSERNVMVRAALLTADIDLSPQLVRALAWSTISAQVAADIIVSMRDRGRELDVLLALWASRGAISGRSGGSLVRNVMVPALNSGSDGAARLISEHLHLASRVPREDRDVLVKAIADARVTRGVAAGLWQKAEEAGLVKKRGRRGWIPGL